MQTDNDNRVSQYSTTHSLVAYFGVQLAVFEYVCAFVNAQVNKKKDCGPPSETDVFHWHEELNWEYVGLQNGISGIH